RNEIDLVSEGGLVLAHPRQRRAQIARELSEHRAARGGVALAKPANVGERVEQEMRLDLRLQQAQARRELLCLERAAAQLRGVRLRLARLRAQVEHVARDENRPRADP